MLLEKKRRCNFLCQSRGRTELGPEEQVKISTKKTRMANVPLPKEISEQRMQNETYTLKPSISPVGVRAELHFYTLPELQTLYMIVNSQ